jgi:hypothetical protein
VLLNISRAGDQFASVALYSGVGLLISLIVVILRINGIF